jgi:benzoyl-CoA reductase/2-hydroxyglutaryl-CoA dehydratase subunit BcrC/BadD/HgdB
MKSLADKILKEANIIHKKALEKKADWIITNSKFSKVIEDYNKQIERKKKLNKLNKHDS